MHVTFSNTSCGLKPGYLPTTGEYFASLSTGYTVALSLCFIMTVVTILSYLESVAFLVKNLGNWKPKDKAIWIMGLYPVLCTTSMIGLLVPRSATLNDMVAAIYLSLCVYLFVVMLMGHFGGQHRMSKKLASKKINLRSAPLFCCCKCLPILDVNKKRLRILELTVLQFAVVRPLLAYIAAVMWSDMKFEAEDIDADSSYTWINVINICSTLLAIYGFIMVYKISRIPLQKMSVKPKFLVLQLVIVISTFQHVFIAIFVIAGVVPCDPPLTAQANGDRWHHMLFIIEMFTLSWFARFYYRRYVGSTPVIYEDTTPDLTRNMQSQLPVRRHVGENDRGTIYGTNESSNGIPSISCSVANGNDETEVNNQLEDIFGPDVAGRDGPIAVASATENNTSHVQMKEGIDNLNVVSSDVLDEDDIDLGIASNERITKT